MAKDARKEWKAAMGARLGQEFKRLGLTQSEVARQLEITRALSNHWTLGHSEISSWDLVRLAKIGVNVSYVMLGDAAAVSGLKLRLPEGVVPYPSHEEVIQIAAGKLDPVSIERVRPVYEPLANGLAIDCVDAAMQPLLPAGKATIIVDRDRGAEDDEIVAVVLSATRELLIRRLKGGRGKRFLLKPDNRLFEQREVTEKHAPVILGTMIMWSVSGSH
jgi:transcriptional regulator with XRE-family HTH domain